MADLDPPGLRFAAVFSVISLEGSVMTLAVAHIGAAVVGLLFYGWLLGRRVRPANSFEH